MNKTSCLMLLGAVSVFACKPVNYQQSEVENAFNKLFIEKSYLKEIDKTGAVNICARAMDSTDTSANDIVFHNIQVAFAGGNYTNAGTGQYRSAAAIVWNNALSGYSDWKHSQISVNFETGDRCAHRSDVIKVDFYFDRNKFTKRREQAAATYGVFKTLDCTKYPSLCRSFARPIEREIIFDLSSNRTGMNKGTNGLSIDFLVMHEYGHMLGLMDTYYEKGKLDFGGGHPASVMNGGSGLPTEDDKVGLRNAWDMIKGRRGNFLWNNKQCAPGYHRKDAPSKTDGILYCLPD